MRSTKNDFELIVQGCKKGDRASQHLLFEQYYGLMKMICLRYAANEMEAEDLCHDGFLKVFEKIKKFKGAGLIRRLDETNFREHGPLICVERNRRISWSLLKTTIWVLKMSQMRKILLKNSSDASDAKPYLRAFKSSLMPTVRFSTSMLLRAIRIKK